VSVRHCQRREIATIDETFWKSKIITGSDGFIEGFGRLFFEHSLYGCSGDAVVFRYLLEAVAIMAI
jgi:hypothetical protein